MKRRAEFLVEKRDGRTEFLRATKLARSVHLALRSAGVDEDWRALEVASAVLAGLRDKREREQAAGRPASVLTTSELADAVTNVLAATGQASAAVAFATIGAERLRRRRALATLGRPGAACEVAAGNRLAAGQEPSCG